MTIALEPTVDGLRAHVDEARWAAVVAAAFPHGAPASALAPLAEPDASASPDEPLTAAARLALGQAPVHIEIQTGSHDRGLIAQVGCDAATTGIAVRALVPAGDGSGALAVPGVEIGANHSSNVIAELMRLFPAGGLSRLDVATPVTLPHDLSLTLNQALRAGDDQLARHISEHLGWAAAPEMLVSLAAGTTASATLTIRVASSPTTVVQQWLLCDAGWVLLTVRGTQVTHTLQSRDEVRATLVRLLAGAFATEQAAGRG